MVLWGVSPPQELFAGGFRRLSLLSLPLGGKVAPKGPDEGAVQERLFPGVGRDDSARHLSGIVCAEIFRRCGGE